MPVQNNRGITLLPLILMVVVFGALIGVGTGIIKQRVQRNQQQKAVQTMTSAVQSIISWSIENGALPIWGDNTPDATTDEFCEIVKETDDPWHQGFTYIYDGALASGVGGGICGKTSTGISAGGTGNIAFVLLSPGQDRTVTSTPGVPGAFSGVVASSATDIVSLVTLEQLRNALGCFTSTRGRLTLLNRELPDACAGQPYEATLFAEGGVPAYTWNHTISAAWITPITPSNTHLTLQGTPPSLGTENFDVTVTDADGNTFLRRFSLEVISCGTGPGPVSEWDFDEGSGPVARDGAGPNDGTLNGDVAWTGDTPDGTGTALSFDGNGDWVNVPDDASLQLVDELTLSAWVKERVPHTYAKVISRRSGRYFYFLGVDNGRPYGGIGDGSVYEVTGKSLLMSTVHWNHLSVAYYDAQDTKYMHFTGTERPSTVRQNLPRRRGVNVSIGGDSQGTSNFFVGTIDDVAVYNAALSSADIRQLYENHSHPNLVASYYFNGSAADSSGNGHDGTNNGASLAPDRYGNPDRALNFDGNDYVLVSDHRRLRLRRTLTITAWIKETTRRPYTKILSRRSGSYFYFLGVDNGRPYGGIGDGRRFTVTRKSIDMPLDQWHFLAFVFDSRANSMHIYYDGILDETAVTTSLPVLAGVDLSIGADFEGTGNFFEGLIDGVAIYDQALTAEEIRGSY